MGRRRQRAYPNLRAYFDEPGHTQDRIAKRLNRSQSWVSRVTNGEIEPNLADALLLSRIANVPLESLISTASANAESR